MLTATNTPRWRAWLLLAVACWAGVAPAFALTFTSGFSLRGPETRVWNFFPQSAETRQETEPQVADPHQGNEGYGYETVSGVHVYLYANADPVGRMDPSGHFSMVEVQIGMVIVGTLNGMAINSARNTLGQASDTFSPTGEIAESLATLEQVMFVYEQINFAVAAGTASVLAKRGLEVAWKIVGPKLGKAWAKLSQANPTKVIQAQIGRSRSVTNTISQLEFNFTQEIGDVSGLVIGRNKDLSRPGALRVGEYRLDWFAEALSDEMNISVNIQKLQDVMQHRLPIRDASSQMDTSGIFTNVERLVLQDAMWFYEWSPSSGGYWFPPN